MLWNNIGKLSLSFFFNELTCHFYSVVTFYCRLAFHLSHCGTVIKKNKMCNGIKPLLRVQIISLKNIFGGIKQHYQFQRVENLVCYLWHLETFSYRTALPKCPKWMFTPLDGTGFWPCGVKVNCHIALCYAHRSSTGSVFKPKLHPNNKKDICLYNFAFNDKYIFLHGQWNETFGKVCRLVMCVIVEFMFQCRMTQPT